MPSLGHFLESMCGHACMSLCVCVCVCVCVYERFSMHLRCCSGLLLGVSPHRVHRCVCLCKCAFESTRRS